MHRTMMMAAALTLLMAGSTAAKAQFSGLEALGVDAGTANLVHQTGRRSRRNARIAAGVVAGVAGAIAINELYRSERRREARRWSRHRRNCRRWLRLCEYGSDRSCWRYDTRCH